MCYIAFAMTEVSPGAYLHAGTCRCLCRLSM